MKGLFLAAMVAMLCAVLAVPAMAGDSVTQVGFIDHPDGTMTKVYEARTDRLMHQEEVKFLSYRTASEKSELTGKFVPKTRLESDPQAVGGMAWLGKGVSGFISNIPQAAGNAFGLWALGSSIRPATTSYSGGQQSMTNSYKNWMAQGQGQAQGQLQGQLQGQNLINQDHPILSPATALAP